METVKQKGIVLNMSYVAPKKRKGVWRSFSGLTFEEAFEHAKELIKNSRGKFLHGYSKDCELWDKRSYKMVFIPFESPSIPLSDDLILTLNNQ